MSAIYWRYIPAKANLLVHINMLTVQKRQKHPQLTILNDLI